MTFFRALLPKLGLTAFVMSLAVSARAASQEPFEVVGWPVPRLDQDVPDFSLGDDPVTGRQLCPALTRLNLVTHHSEELLLKRVVEEFRDERRGSLWRLELRAGIFWWNGEAVTSGDVAAYIKTIMPELVKQRGAGLWPLPDFDVKADGPADVVVRWKQLPVFGPFVFNDAPFYRAAKARQSMKYECAGLYRPVQEGFGITLKPSAGYKLGKELPEVRIYRVGARPVRGGGKLFELRLASAPVDRAEDAKPKTCKQTITLPYATLMTWNTSRGPTANKAFRQLMTQLIPRGVLASSGSADLAEVAAIPVPRIHPGFNSDIKPRAFDMRRASEELGALGYKRKTASSPRVDAADKPLSLLLLTQPNSPGLVEKVIADAYSAVGIAVRFKVKAEAGEVPDGVLASFGLDWPRVSFIGNFHSKVADTAPFWSPGDKQLDLLLEAYAKTLTMEDPDFKLLTKIQVELADLEPVSVLLQHKACVVTGSGLKLTKAPNQADPDWFRQLLF